MTFLENPGDLTMAGAAEVVEFQATLPVLIERASRTLLEAKSSGEVLEARDMARAAYDAAKSAGRIAKARKAHDEIVAAIHRAQGEAALVRARAEIRLADEMDAAQERGEVASGSVRTDIVPDGNDVRPATAKEIGLDRKATHEARKLRDAEKADPGKAERTVKAIIARGEEPTTAKLRREMTDQRTVVPAEPVDPERRKLAKLTPDALIDEVLGLRADLKEAKAEAAKLKSERDSLKVQVNELRAADSTSVIAQLQIKLKNAENAKWREGEKTADAMRKVHALEKKLRAMGKTEIPL